MSHNYIRYLDRPQYFNSRFIPACVALVFSKSGGSARGRSNYVYSIGSKSSLAGHSTSFSFIMVSLRVARLIFIAASCVLVHSAVSAAQHRSFQRINRQVREAASVDSTTAEMKLPFDIMLETVISAVIVLWSFVQMTVKLKNIRPESEYEKRTVEFLDFRPSFMVFGQKQSLYNLRLLDQKTRVSTETPFLLEDSAEQTSPLVDDVEMASS